VGSLTITFVANLLLSLTVKEFWKSVKMWQSYHHDFGGPVFFFWNAVQYSQQRNNNCLMALCPRSTRVSRYEKKYSPTNHPDYPVSISFFHLAQSMASPLFKLRAWQSFLHNLSPCPLVYLLVWSPPPHIPNIFHPIIVFFSFNIVLIIYIFISACYFLLSLPILH